MIPGEATPGEATPGGPAPARVHGRVARLGALVVRKRGVALAPLFVASVFLVRPCARESELEASALALALASWGLRVWAMGYRNWVRGPGSRHLMTRGPYAWVRHPRYVANFLGGLAWFALAFDPWLALAYTVVYWALLGVVIVREEEKLAQDYPDHAAWRARVPAFVPLPWRGPYSPEAEPGGADAAAAGPAPTTPAPTTPAPATPDAARWDARTVVTGLEPLKLALFLAALAALACARRTGLALGPLH